MKALHAKNKSTPTVAVILSTYNAPEWLALTLHGYVHQTDADFQIVIADDGSNDATRKLVEEFQATTSLNIKHVWHPDDGFQKCLILNKAIQAADADYLILSDGDCIPRNDFIAVHKAEAEEGYFLSGGYFKLPFKTSHQVTPEIIEAGACFASRWLTSNGVRRNLKLLKLTQSKILRALCNGTTPTKRTWNGHNASCFKKDALKVNGFDERMRYGGQDVEFGFRLKNSGLRAKQIRYSAICVHLEHERGYCNASDLALNMQIRKATLSEQPLTTAFGIQKEI
jgi:glycosyltransferase involved in cell wall biosynthesis